MKKKEKIIHTLVYFAFGLIVLIWAIFMFWSFYPYKTIEQEQPYKLVNNVVKQGDIIQYEMVYCKYSKVNPIVNRQFIDGIIYAMPVASAQIQRGCGQMINSVEIPKSLPSGTYYMKVIVDYEVNPIRHIVHEFKTEQFTVIK